MADFPKSEWRDYALLDSGNGLKLERFGSYAMIRPEPKALWTPSMSASEWNSLASVRFKPGAGFGKAGKEDSGTWERLADMPGQWFVQYPGEGFSLRMRLGLTAFKHIGIFPEQAPNWEFIYRKASGASGKEAEGVPPETRATLGIVRGGTASAVGSSTARRSKGVLPSADATKAQKVLNLFAYTGGASLAARAAGADVTHLDSVRQVVSWARENMEATGLRDIRWVVEDALKFATREAKRGRKYDGIILDPPAYGHGPDGEKWKLDELLFGMLRTVHDILAPHGWMVLNLYSNGYSAALGETVVREAFGLKAQDNSAAGNPHGSYRITSGELALNDKFGKALPLSIYVRLEL